MCFVQRYGCVLFRGIGVFCLEVKMCFVLRYRCVLFKGIFVFCPDQQLWSVYCYNCLLFRGTMCSVQRLHCVLFRGIVIVSELQLCSVQRYSCVLLSSTVVFWHSDMSVCCSEVPLRFFKENAWHSFARLEINFCQVVFCLYQSVGHLGIVSFWVRQ